MAKCIIPIILFLCVTSCTPIIKTSRLERQRARADSVLTRSPEKQAQIDQEKEYHRTGAKISVAVLIAWFIALENFKEKD